MGTFRNSMMLYRASLSVWTARKKDKEQSNKATVDAGAVDGSANVHKALLPESPELMAVQKWATSFRSWLYATTLVWDDHGGRVAMVEKHMDFMVEAGERIRVGDQLVEEFMAGYAQAIEQAKFTLNGMFNASDYPTPDQVRRKFAFGIECEAVPDAADFRIVEGLPAEEVERLVSEAAASVEARVKAAMDELYDRLYEVVAKMASTLTLYGNKEIKKFNDTLISNITDLTALIPALNLTSDKHLTGLATEAARLATYDLRDLRSMPEVRDAAIKEARALAMKFGRDSVADIYASVAAKMKTAPAAPTTTDPTLDYGKLAAERAALAAPTDAPARVKPALDPVSLGEGWGE